MGQWQWIKDFGNLKGPINLTENNKYLGETSVDINRIIELNPISGTYRSSTTVNSLSGSLIS